MKIENFKKLTIEQIENTCIEVIKENEELKKRIKVYQEDIQQKKHPTTAQEVVDFAE